MQTDVTVPATVLNMRRLAFHVKNARVSERERPPSGHLTG